MRLGTPLCPECGEPARGTVERLSGCAEFIDADDDDRSLVDWSGTTDVWWDEQRTETETDDPGSRCLLICEDAHQWWSTMEDA